MIEILFGESEGVAMKLAKNYQQPDLLVLTVTAR